MRKKLKNKILYLKLCQTKEGDQKYVDSERDYKWLWHQRDSIVKSSCCRYGNVNIYKINVKDNPGRATVCLIIFNEY